MSRIGYTLKHCGASLTFRKVIRTLKRYGITSHKMWENIKIFSEILSKYRVQGNIFIPAKTIQNDIEMLKNTAFDNIHFGVHGYMHIDYAALPLDEQKEHFEKSLEIFSSLGMQHIGFRAPYGRLSKESVGLLTSLGYAFDSSQVFLYDNIVTKTKPLKDALSDYDVVGKNGPYRDGNIVRVPFTLPDDEILVDRLNYGRDVITEIWCRMIEAMEEYNNLLVLQLHPNRIRELAAPLEFVISKSIERGVDIVDIYTLINEYQGDYLQQNRRFLCITGDVDSLSLMEFIK